MEKRDFHFDKPKDQEKPEPLLPEELGSEGSQVEQSGRNEALPVGDQGSLIKVRKHRNLERGTELDYVTVPLKEVDFQSPQFEREIMALLNKFYGEGRITYKVTGYGSEKENLRFENTIKQFIEDSNKKEMVIRLHELDENGKTKVGPEGEGQYYEQFLTLTKVGERLMIAPTPMIHAISTRIHQVGDHHLKSNSFDDLNHCALKRTDSVCLLL